MFDSSEESTHSPPNYIMGVQWMLPDLNCMAGVGEVSGLGGAGGVRVGDGEGKGKAAAGRGRAPPGQWRKVLADFCGKDTNQRCVSTDWSCGQWQHEFWGSCHMIWLRGIRKRDTGNKIWLKVTMSRSKLWVLFVLQHISFLSYFHKGNETSDPLPRRGWY